MVIAEKIYIPPIKIQGIKTKLVPLIKQLVCIDKDTTWVEPFMGSGVVGLNIAPHRAIFADTNPHIIAFYNHLQNGVISSGMIAQHLREEGELLAQKGEKYYYYVRDRFNDEHSSLDFLFLNRSCFNGMIRFNKNYKFNVPYGHKPERFAKAYITKIVNQVKHFEHMLRSNDWVFICQSFEDTIAMADESAFVYCDPPYIGRHVDYYDSWDVQEEMKLYECLQASCAKFMLSTWDFNQYRQNEYIDQIWRACNKTTKEHFYFVGAKEKNRNSMMEALLTNYICEIGVNQTAGALEQMQFVM